MKKGKEKKNDENSQVFWSNVSLDVLLQAKLKSTSQPTKLKIPMRYSTSTLQVFFEDFCNLILVWCGFVFFLIIINRGGDYTRELQMLRRLFVGNGRTRCYFLAELYLLFMMD